MAQRWGKYSGKAGGSGGSYSSRSTAGKGRPTYLSKATRTSSRYARKAVETAAWTAARTEEDDNPSAQAPSYALRLIRDRKKAKTRSEKARTETKARGHVPKKTAGESRGAASGQDATTKQEERPKNSIEAAEGDKATRKPAKESTRSSVARALRSSRNRARLSVARRAAARKASKAAETGIASASKAQAGKAIASKATAAAASIAPVALPVLIGVLLVVFTIVAVVGISSSVNTGKLTGNEATVALYLLGKGLDSTHAAAIMGNMEAESGIDPTANEVGGGGRGLCQWTGGRFSNLEEYAASTGKEWQDIHVQLDYLWAELTGEGDAAAYADVQYDHAGFLAISDLEECVMYFGRNFERPNEYYAHWERRTASAQKYLSAMSGNGLGADGVAGSALTKIGCPYVWGAAGPDSYDCSGLVLWSYQQSGIMNMGRTTYDQISQCRIISKEEAQPGDLIFMIFSSPGVPEHVGIYIGDGMMVHAPTFGSSVKIDEAGWTYSDAVYARYIGS